MKLYNYLYLFLLISVMSACTNDDNNSSSSSSNSQQISSDLTVGEWRITYFVDNEKNETTNYNGFRFTFTKNRIINATKNSNSYSGTWVLDTDSSDDNPQSDLDLIISFNTNNNLMELNDDWDIISSSSTKIVLKDVSGGNGGIDYLTFER